MLHHELTIDTFNAIYDSVKCAHPSFPFLFFEASLTALCSHYYLLQKRKNVGNNKLKNEKYKGDSFSIQFNVNHDRVRVEKEGIM